MFVTSMEMESWTHSEFCVYRLSLRCLLDIQVQMSNTQPALGLHLSESGPGVRDWELSMSRQHESRGP